MSKQTRKRLKEEFGKMDFKNSTVEKIETIGVKKFINAYRELIKKEPEGLTMIAERKKQANLLDSILKEHTTEQSKLRSINSRGVTVVKTLLRSENIKIERNCYGLNPVRLLLLSLVKHMTSTEVIDPLNIIKLKVDLDHLKTSIKQIEKDLNKKGIVID